MTNTMTNAQSTIENKPENPYIFIEFPHEGHYTPEGAVLRTIYVGKKEWFNEIPLTETYDRYGQLYDGEDNDYQVTAYTYWNGSNHQTLIIESADFDVHAIVIDDEDEIAEYSEIVRKIEDGAVYLEEAGTGFEAATVDGKRIVRSYWQGDWELYRIEIRESF